MSLRAAGSFVVVAALAVPAAAEVRVQVAGESVDLAATTAPLSEVLDRLSRQTGMKVVYEGPAPRQLVTLTVRGRTPAQTVLAVLEGQGINYALVTDPSGATVRTLLVAGLASSSPGGAAPARAAAAPSRAPFGPPAGASPDAEPPFEEGEEEAMDDPATFGVPQGTEGVEQAPTGENAPGAPGQPAPPGQPGQAAQPGPTAPPAYQGPIAPPQQFPVSPFAPQPVAPAPPPTVPVPNQPQQGTAPGQSPPQ